MPVLTLQNEQARVQVSPMIMKVACFFSQHSPMFGQPASSQTVTSPFSLTILCVSDHFGEPGALTRIHSGLRWMGWSGRWAFSGCRGRLSRFSVSMSVAMTGPGVVGRRAPPEHASIGAAPPLSQGRIARW